MREEFENWYIDNFHDGEIHPNQHLLKYVEDGGFYKDWVVDDLYDAYCFGMEKQQAEINELHNANVNLLHTKQSMQKRIEHLEELLWGKP